MTIEDLRERALKLPHVTEDVKWGNDLCFLIADKMFCVTGLSGDFSASIKVQAEEFEELSSRPGIIPAPYLARYKWVLVQGEASLSDDEWDHYLQQSYQLVKSKLPKKKQAELS